MSSPTTPQPASYVAAESGRVTTADNRNRHLTVTGRANLAYNAHVVAVDSTTHPHLLPRPARHRRTSGPPRLPARTVTPGPSSSGPTDTSCAGGSHGAARPASLPDAVTCRIPASAGTALVGPSARARPPCCACSTASKTPATGAVAFQGRPRCWTASACPPPTSTAPPPTSPAARTGASDQRSTGAFVSRAARGQAAAWWCSAA
jgi:hypothetical protein